LFGQAFEQLEAMVTTATPVALPPGLNELLSSLAAIPAERRTPQQAALLAELSQLAGEPPAKPSGFGAPPPAPTGAAVVRGLTRLSERQLDRTTSPPDTTTRCWLCGR
jgi:hypothetical protein